MKKINNAGKGDIRAIFVISGVFLAMLLLTFLSGGGKAVWGSELDWSSQHFALPEYLRTRFYETHDLFPDFSYQLGAGQNIYNFAYYGLFSPLYLPAYLMPGITMAAYIQGIGMAAAYCAAVMGYFFFKRHFSGKKPLILAVMLMCAAPLIFHSHRHIMFMDYYPFLMALMFGAGKADSMRNSLFMAAMSFCMVCTSFYYSAGAFAAVGMYMIFLQLDSGNTKILAIIREIWRKVLFCGMGCVCAAVLWMPTLGAILSGRAPTAVKMSIGELFTPTVDLSALLYTPYSAGLCSVCAAAVIAMLLTGKASERFIAAVMACCVFFPVILYIFNGTMYADSKALIPFSPLILILCGRFFDVPGTERARTVTVLVIFIVSAVMTLILHDFTNVVTGMIIADTVLGSIFIFISGKTGRKQVLEAGAVVCSLLICIVNCFRDSLAARSAVKELYCDEVTFLINSTLDADRDGIYRFAGDSGWEESMNMVYRTDHLHTNIYSSLNNRYYRDFRFYGSGCEVATRNNAIMMQPLNIVFDTLMGCRYRLDRTGTQQLGETYVDSSGKYTVLRNENALPLGYSSANIMSEDVFEKLPAQERAAALLGNIIVPEGGHEGDIKYHAERIDADFTPIADIDGISLDGDTFTIDMSSEAETEIILPQPLENKLLIMTCHADNDLDSSRYSDITLEINGVLNKLTDPTWKYKNKNYDFSYVISSSEPVTSLKMRFSGGYYRISELSAYALDAEVLRSANEGKDGFEIEREGAVGDRIHGSIDETEDGWFNISVPYDDGFRITVDGAEVEYFRTNTAFIGFPISAGQHEITVDYEAPLKNAGLAVSTAGIVLTLLLSFLFKRSEQKVESRN